MTFHQWVSNLGWIFLDDLPMTILTFGSIYFAIRLAHRQIKRDEIVSAYTKEKAGPRAAGE